MPGDSASPPPADGDPARSWRELTVAAQDGLLLHARDYGSASNTSLPVICLPGLTRSARDFHELAVALSTHKSRARRVVAIDLRGRGASQRDSDWRHYNPLTEAQDVLDIMTAIGLPHAGFVGTSRGGLVMMVMAAMRPTVLKAAVLNDIGPEIDGRGLIRIKNTLKAMRAPASWDEAARLLRQAYETSFPTVDERGWEIFARKTFVDADGKPAIDYDPKILKPLTKMDFDRPLSALWAQFDGLSHVPVMTVRGASSDILSAETLERMQARRPDMQTLVVENAGHAPFLVDDAETGPIAAFLAGVDGRRRASAA